VWYTDPETGESGYIEDGYLSIGLVPRPEWEPPADTDYWDQQFIEHPTVQALIEEGYELLFPFGIIMSGTFQTPEGMSFAEAEFQIQSDPLMSANVDFVDPEWVVDLHQNDPNDPWYWFYGPEGERQWYLWNLEDYFDVGARFGWTIETGSENVVTAVIDTGVARNLADLHRLTQYGWNLRGPYPPPAHTWGSLIVEGGGTPMDSHPGGWYHGTEVSSLITANTDNWLDMAGGTWAGLVLPIAISQPAAGSLSIRWIKLAYYLLLDQVNMIYYGPVRWLPRYGVRVVNMSYGHPGRDMQEMWLLYYLSQQTVLVASAGNAALGGNPRIYPAAYDCIMPGPIGTDIILGVTAFDRHGYRPPFASYFDPELHVRNWVDVSAPGAEILVLDPREPYYRINDGTSFSAPLTSALASLLFAHYPDYTAHQVQTAIEINTADFPPLNSPEIPERINYRLALYYGDGS